MKYIMNRELPGLDMGTIISIGDDRVWANLHINIDGKTIQCNEKHFDLLINDNWIIKIDNKNQRRKNDYHKR